MKPFLPAATLLVAQPALSHVSDSPLYLHSTEHTLWALALLLAVSVPAAVLLRRVAKNARKR